MKQMILILLPLSSILLKSCLYSDCEVVYIPEEHKFWLNLYEENDTLIFESNLGRYDTLVMTEIESDISPCNKFELGSFQYESKSFYLRSKVSDRAIFLRVSSNNTDCFDFNGFRYCARDSIGIEKEQFSFHDSDHNVEKYYYINSANRNDYDQNRIDSFAISNKLGFVKFSTQFGEVYSLIKHVSSSKK
jgi:hypothetical protein